ncbi:E3 ubiquitin-protein ligase KEG-like [Amphibalanus amphitrite]|uniref:E3 ubiquitin-protein ligase KEG-like n=1 Tax=Amphibalanus amphitrite TaxID=1232801 RepID=UPI001C910B02|nr:E3 ubiquitin-protein ligase KEG-like [Amphibalanus amphitrite]
MSDAGAAQAVSETAQLVSADDYAKQIRDKIAVGRTVRCRRCYRKVHETDIGTVTKLDKDGLHDLNVQVHWHKAGGASWVRYVHVELLEDSGVRLGEQVRVRRSVVRPKYGWGSVNHDSVGKVTGLSSDGDVIVHFPEKRGWKALMSELEPATAERREEAVRKKIGVGDQVRVKRSVDEPRFKWGNVTHNSVGKVTGKD